jgi:hypothetical protein
VLVVEGSQRGAALQEREEVPSDAEPRRFRTARHAATLPDVAFGVLLAFTVISRMASSSDYGFFGDDWRLASRGGNAADFFRPFNGHLSVVLIAMYKALFEVFGLTTATPFRLLSVLSGAAVAVAVYLVVRRRLGAAVALVAGSMLLWNPGTVVLSSQVNFFLPLVAIVLVSALLDSDEPRWDLMIAGLLAFALLTSGVGVAGAVGAIAYVVLGPATARRRAAVLVPTLCWFTWWATVAAGRTHPSDLSVGELAEFVRAEVFGSFRSLAFDNRIGGIVLLIGFAAVLAWRLRAGLQVARHQLAWTAALAFWWLSIAYTRAALGQPDSFRYRFVASTLLVVAILPAETPRRLRRGLQRHPVVAAAVVAALAAVALNGPGIADAARNLRSTHEGIHARLVVANLGPEVVPDGTAVPLGAFMQLSAGELRALIARLGSPPGTRPENPDAAVIELRHWEPVPVDPTTGPCKPLGSSAVAVPQAIELRGGDRVAAVQVRRFGSEWVEIGQVAPGEEVRVAPPGLGAVKPWLLRAEGACRVELAPITANGAPVDSAVLSGIVTLGASADGTVDATVVELRITGGAYSDEPIGQAIRTVYGWSLEWDTTSVPDGTYELTSVVRDRSGVETTSRPVTVTVRN